MTARRAVLITGPGFQDCDVVHLYQRALEAGFDVEVATAGGRALRGRCGVTAPLDRRAKPCIAFEQLDVAHFDLALLPGGREAADGVRESRDVLEFVRRMDAGGKVVAGLCHGSSVMISAGIMGGRDACADAGVRHDMVEAGAAVTDADVVVDRNLVTGSRHEAVGAFMTAVIDVCEGRRQLAAP